MRKRGIYQHISGLALGLTIPAFVSGVYQSKQKMAFAEDFFCLCAKLMKRWNTWLRKMPYVLCWPDTTFFVAS